MRDTRPLVFLGTPDAAATVLDSLIAAGCEIVHVITRPDARRGRGSERTPSPVKTLALGHGLEVSDDLSWLEAHASTDVLGVVVAYGKIIPARILDRIEMLNVHFSLLPRWRGAAPVERAILAGDSVTGVCIMGVEATLDTGPVYARAEVPIDDATTAEELTHALAQRGGDLLVELLAAGLGTPEPQIGEATYADKIDVSDCRIDWTRSAAEVHRQIRAVRAFTMLNGARVRILECAMTNGHVAHRAPGVVDAGAQVATSDGLLQLVMVQPEGKPAMDAAAWLRGRQNDAVIRFD